MDDKKNIKPETNYGYQPNKKIIEGYQPAESVKTQPPNKGSNVQPSKNDKT